MTRNFVRPEISRREAKVGRSRPGKPRQMYHGLAVATCRKALLTLRDRAVSAVECGSPGRRRPTLVNVSHKHHSRGENRGHTLVKTGARPEWR
jgi:hypothetical protein